MDMSEARHRPLDPGRGPDRWEAAVEGIMRAAAPELARRRQQAGLMPTLLAWARPALSAAATIAVLFSLGVAVNAGRAAPASEPTLADALVPDEVARWLIEGYQPTVTEVVVALEEAIR